MYEPDVKHIYLDSSVCPECKRTADMDLDMVAGSLLDTYEVPILSYVAQAYYGSKISPNGFIKVVTGIRRCGKSYLLFNLFKDHLLDEVQLLGEFESALNSLIRMKNVDVYVTGSNAWFLSKDVILDQAKMEQEQRSLMLTGDFFKRTIITKDAPTPYYNDDGVQVMGIYDFLLNEGEPG